MLSNNKSKKNSKKESQSYITSFVKSKKNLNHTKKNYSFQKIMIIAFLFFFGGTYLIFQIKLKRLKKEVKVIESRSLEYKEKQRVYWLEKYKSDVNSNQRNFVFDDEKTVVKHDTFVSFLFWKDFISFNLYKECFFECAYYDNKNGDKHDQFTVLDHEDSRKRNNYFYPKLINEISKKYSISKKDVEDLVFLATGDRLNWRGEHAFIKSDPNNQDLFCLECYDEYLVNHSLNNSALNDFNDFVESYQLSKAYMSILNEQTTTLYLKDLKNLTSNMSSSLKEKVQSKLDKSSVMSYKKKYYNYDGSNNGLESISYSINQVEYDFSILNKIISDVSDEYYLNNSLKNGSIPYKYCYGRNPSCSPSYGYLECSSINIEAPKNSDVLVIVKKRDKVYAHAYIKAGGYYKFKVGNGNFQTFFYYGNGWNPNKFMKEADCGPIFGGFINDVSIAKSDLERVYNSSLTYTLYSVYNGNFMPKSSNVDEAF